MATKAALAAALLMALVALATATTFTTTVTTISADEEDSKPGYQQCQQQLKGRQFRSCQRYLEQRRSSPYSDELEEDALEMSTGRPYQQEYLQQCCQELKQMDRQQCGCEAIKHAVRQTQQQQEGGRPRYEGRQSEQQEGGRPKYGGSQSEQIYKKAQSLPRICGLRQQQCRFNLVFV